MIGTTHGIKTPLAKTLSQSKFLYITDAVGDGPRSIRRKRLIFWALGFRVRAAICPYNIPIQPRYNLT